MPKVPVIMSAQEEELYLVAYDPHCGRDGKPMPPDGDSEEEPEFFEAGPGAPVMNKRKVVSRRENQQVFVPSDMKLVSMIDQSEPLDIKNCPPPGSRRKVECLLAFFGQRLVEQCPCEPQRLDLLLDQVLCGTGVAAPEAWEQAAKYLWKRYQLAGEHHQGYECSFDVGAMEQSVCHIHNYGVMRGFRITLCVYNEGKRGKNVQTLYHVDVGDRTASTRGFVMVCRDGGRLRYGVLSWRECKRGCRPVGESEAAESSFAAEFPPTGGRIPLTEGDNVFKIPDGSRVMPGSIPCVVTEVRNGRQHVVADSRSAAESLTQLRGCVTSLHEQGRKMAYLDADPPAEITDDNTWLVRNLVLGQLGPKQAKGDAALIVANEIEPSDPKGIISLTCEGKAYRAEWTSVKTLVRPISPTNHPLSTSWFTLRYPTVDASGRQVDGFQIQTIFIDRASLVYVAATDLLRGESLILVGECGSQSLDDMYICARIPGVLMDCSFTNHKKGVACVISSKAGKKTQVKYFVFHGDVVNMVPVFSAVMDKGTDNAELVVVQADGKVAFAKKGASQWSIWEPEVVGTNPNTQSTPTQISRLESWHGMAYIIDSDNKGKCLQQPTFFTPREYDLLGRDDDAPDESEPLETHVAALEVERRLYLRTNSTTLYRPAMRNILKKANIISTFHRYLRHGVPIPIANPQGRMCITCVIDLGLQESARRTFKSGTYPGVYMKVEEDKYSHDTEIQVTSVKLFFINGSLPVGVDCHRSMCQLWAAFCYGTQIDVYGPGKAHCLHHMTDPVFGPLPRVQHNISALFALYGTLLALDPKDLDLAIDTLEVTRINTEEFREFMRGLRH